MPSAELYHKTHPMSNFFPKKYTQKNYLFSRNFCAFSRFKPLHFNALKRRRAKEAGCQPPPNHTYNPSYGHMVQIERSEELCPPYAPTHKIGTAILALMTYFFLRMRPRAISTAQQVPHTKIHHLIF
jgi:hypothetical protein